jgi:hypothetical protein
MSSIFFDDGVLVTTYPTDASTGKLVAWLEYQRTLGAIVATATPPTPPAFFVEAANAGAYGNRIEVVTAASSTKVGALDVTVSATDSYGDVKVAGLADLLGTSGHPGTQPGILHVADAPAGAAKPKQGTVAKAGAADEWVLAGAATGPAVKLAPRITGADFEAGDVVVSIEDGDDDKFTLVVTWSATAAGVLPAGFAAAFSAFAFLVTVSQPSGPPFPVPRAGTVSLTGGSEQRAATKAKATVLADD